LGILGANSADTTVGRCNGHTLNVPGFIARGETLQMELEQAAAAEEYEKLRKYGMFWSCWIKKERMDNCSFFTIVIANKGKTI
jgi:hypothetical protein